MDFGDILNDWERKQKKDSQADKTRALLEQWLDSEDAWRSYDKGEDFESSANNAGGMSRTQLRKMAPQDQIDLHGCTRDEALRRLDRFVRSSVREGRRKVLVVHGKGNHSPDGAVLRQAVWDYLRRSTLVGEIGAPGRELGGSGATWALLRVKKR